MEIQSAEIKVGIGDFRPTYRFYEHILGMRVAFKSNRMALLVLNDEYILIEAIEDEAAAALPSSVICITCENLYATQSTLDSKAVDLQISDTTWDTFLLTLDPAGHVCQFKESGADQLAA